MRDARSESQINGALFRRIADNDPTLTELVICYFPPIEPGPNDWEAPQVRPSTDEEWAECGKVIGQNRHIEKVVINTIPDDQTIRRTFLNAFAKFVERNPNLAELHKRTNVELGEVGMRIIARALNRREVRSIKKVRIHVGDFNDDSLAGLCAALRRHPVESIDLYGNYLSTRCLTEIASILRGRNTTLTELILDHCLVDDDGAIIVANALVRRSRLQKLNLQRNIIGGDGIDAFADSLTDNASVTELLLTYNPGTESERGWNAFLGLIGGEAGQSINETYIANHTLWRVAPALPDHLFHFLPRELIEFLQLNRNADKLFVARAKVFKRHLEGDFDLRPFLNMKTKILPHVLCWVGRDGSADDEDSDMDSIGTVKSRRWVCEFDDCSVDSGEVYSASHEFGEGSAEHCLAAGIGPPRPEFNLLSVMYRLVRLVLFLESQD